MGPIQASTVAIPTLAFVSLSKIALLKVEFGNPHHPNAIHLSSGDTVFLDERAAANIKEFNFIMLSFRGMNTKWAFL
jgi:hypothetical protein